jgi:hypothetical protein
MVTKVNKQVIAKSESIGDQVFISLSSHRELGIPILLGPAWLQRDINGARSLFRLSDLGTTGLRRGDWRHRLEEVTILDHLGEIINLDVRVTMALSTLQVKLRMALQQHLKLSDGGNVPSAEACDYQLVIHYSFGVFVSFLLT